MYGFSLLQTSLGITEVYLDVIGLELILYTADATDPFGSSQFSMESLGYYLYALGSLTPLSEDTGFHTSVPAHSLVLLFKEIKTQF